MKSLLKSIARFAFAALILMLFMEGFDPKGLQARTVSGDNTASSDLNAGLIKASSVINQHLPMMIDRDTRLDSVAGGNGQFRYNYTAVNYTVGDT